MKTTTTTAVCMLSVNFLLAGCSPGQMLGPTITPSPTNTPLPTATATSTPTNTPVPTSTSTPTPSIPEGIIRFQGRVYRSDQNQGVSGAEVTVSDTQYDAKDSRYQVGKTTTGSDGTYLIELELGSGHYIMTASAQYSTKSELPCVPTAMLTTNALDQFMIVGSLKAGGFIVDVVGSDFSITTGSVKELDFDMACKG